MSEWWWWVNPVASAILGALLSLAIHSIIFRCKHAWELVDKTEVPSFLEQYKFQTFRAQGCDPDELCRRTVVVVLRCPKCGRARIHKVS